MIFGITIADRAGVTDCGNWVTPGTVDIWWRNNMPPEHELIFSMMASILHACRKNQNIDLKVVRLKLVRAKRGAGLRGRYNWSNSVKHGVDQVCLILSKRDNIYERWYGQLLRRPRLTDAEKRQKVIEACEVALKKPRLVSPSHERTWQEHIVGRATLASRTYFPNLTND